MQILPNSRFQLVSNQSSSILEKETIILDFEKGIYFELNEVGGYVWELLQIHKSLSLNEIVTKICDEFEIDEKTCRAEQYVFIESLLNEKLIEKTI